MLKIAVPNKGALSKGAIELIQDAGYKCRRSSRELICNDFDNDVEFIFIRPTDIPTYVGAGIFEFGITGRDISLDSPSEVSEILALGFGKAKLRYIIPKEQNFSDVSMFANKKIATSFPYLVKKQLEKENLTAEIITLDGAVEVSIHLGIADVLVDVVETGTTINQAGLKTVGEPLVKSEAILISKDKTNYKANQAAELFITRLEGIIVARQYVMIEYDVPAENLEKACAISPGLESPTVSPLHDKDWKAVKVMIEKSSINKVMDELAAIGAKAIIVTRIKTCRL